MYLSSAPAAGKQQEWSELACVKHEKPIIAIAVPQDVRRTAFYTANEDIHMIDADLDRSLVMPSNTNAIRNLHVAPDGTIAFSRGTAVEIWGPLGMVRSFEHAETIASMAWRGGLIACATAQHIWVYRLIDGFVEYHFILSHVLETVSMSRDGKILLAHTGQRFAIYSLEDGYLLEQGAVATSAYMSCSAMGLTRAVIGCSDGQSFSVTIGQGAADQKRLWGHTKNVRSVDISKDDERAVSASWDCSLYVWCLNDGVPLREMTNVHSSYVTACRFYGKDDSFIASGSSDKSLKLFDLHSLDRERLLALMHRRERGHELSILPLDVARCIKEMLFGSSSW